MSSSDLLRILGSKRYKGSDCGTVRCNVAWSGRYVAWKHRLLCQSTQRHIQANRNLNTHRPTFSHTDAICFRSCCLIYIPPVFIKKTLLLSTQYFNVFRAILTIISNYFPIQYPQVGLALLPPPPPPPPKKKGNSLVCEVHTKSSYAVYRIVFVCEGFTCCLDMSVRHTSRLC